MADKEIYDGVSVGDHVEVMHDEMTTLVEAGATGTVTGFVEEGEEPMVNRYAEVRTGRKTIKVSPANLSVITDDE